MRKSGIRRARLMCGAAAVALLLPGLASAQTANFNIPSQSLTSALKEFGRQSQYTVVAQPDMLAKKVTPGVSQSADPEVVLTALLAGTGLSYHREGDTFLIVQGGSGPQSASAAGGGAEVDALIVTAQKREENIQDVPIAMSAFSQEDLTTRQVAGGPDLISQVPNMTFTKTNFSSYSIQIRGIGTQAISATTDPAVAVAFNNTSFVHNRFFEQEFYDLERLEVLRGPQGTLYGRNATAGVVNIISAKPKFFYEARLSGDIANYDSTRLEGMVNIPLVADAVSLRLAGAWTKRSGFVENQITGNPIDGRDLWSSRVSLRFAPNDAINADLIWEHFEEDDDRLRSGKQMCKRDDRTELGGYPRPAMSGYSAVFNQSCLPASLYAAESLQAPDGYSLPFYHPLGALGLPTISGFDPYLSTTQSRDLRVIESTVDPEYRAESDLAQFQISVDVSDSLTVTSETAYNADTLFSMQDYNRFNTAPGAFRDSIGGNSFREGVLEDGVWCDPQIGCADRLVAVDLSTAKSRQFSQEFRLSSDFDGNFNFSLGANFLRFDTINKYYVFINTLSLYAAFNNTPWVGDPPPYIGGVTDNSECLRRGAIPPDLNEPQPVTGCIFIDVNPIGSLNDLGHNYFLSKNPYKLVSYAAFGEAYYEITPELKLTAGLRMTVDRKEAPRIPSWLLGGNTVGYPVADVTEQEWREPTGRLALDWKPDLSFTDDTMIYASYAHGYKAGGANPPPAGVVTYGTGAGVAEGLVEQSAAHPKTFEPEFVDAFELGAKNTVLDGRLTLNAAAFYYDYEGYQISYIVNRSAVNLNFDAEIWGAEFEADWRPVENLRLGFKGGYLQTRVAEGMKAIDVMDRTAGNPDWIVARPFPAYPSNCIVPLYTAVGAAGVLTVGPGVSVNGQPGPCELAYVAGLDPVTSLPYVANPTLAITGQLASFFPGYIGFDPSTAPNNGEGFFKDLGGNEMPNAPNFTGALTLDYTQPLSDDWLVTLHGDLHYQSESWARIFNTDGYDKLKANTNVNLAAIFTNEESGWNVMAYVKNVMNRDAITGAFLNSDDTGLTTNVFLTEPRLYGVRVTKAWEGGQLLGSFGGRRDPGDPYPFTVELAGQVQRHDTPYRTMAPAFTSDFSAALNPLAVQNRELDWGDGREIKLTYAPSTAWQASLGVRFGKANASDRFVASEVGDTGCNKYLNPCIVLTATNYSTSDVQSKAEHTLVDFMVGREVGFGLSDNITSRVDAGLRYARLKAKTDVNMYGIPDWDLPAMYAGYSPGFGPASPAHFTRSEADLIADRDFEGVGPVLSWAAATELLGAEDIGHLDLDWSIAAGVLFGKQRTSITGFEETADFDVKYLSSLPRIPTTVDNDPVAIRRENSLTVPVLDASLGLSYTIDRMKIGAGYRWERYFDAMDGGYDEAESYDRTIDGPYFKLSLGFGG